MKPQQVDKHILDLLVDGASSFAALYYGLLHHWGHSDCTVDEALGALRRSEERGLLCARQMEPDGSFRAPLPSDYARASREYGKWLPKATASEVAVDEIGLWYEITSNGRQVWSSGLADFDGDRKRWTLDDHAERKTVEVRAVSIATAEAVLAKWLAEQVGVVEVSGSREHVYISEFAMRDGTKVCNGVRLTCRYHVERP